MAITKRKTNQASNYQLMLADTDSPAICLLWGYRLLVNQQLATALHELLEIEVQLPAKLGLSPHVGQLNPNQLQQLLKQRLRELEQQAEPALPAELERNIAGLAEMLGLNNTEQYLLAFAAMVKTDPLLSVVAGLLPPVKKVNLVSVLAQLLAVTKQDIALCLKSSSNLLHSGLVTMQIAASFGLDDLFDFVSYNFEHNLLADNNDPKQLLKDILQQATPPGLALSHYPHLKTDLQILLPYLKNAVAQGVRGVNILVYGPPGTGKSELVRVLAQKLKMPLYEVSSEDEEGDGISGMQRLRAYRLAQRCLANTRNILLFDEIEDVFTPTPFSRHGEPRKGWMNRMLEQNTVPCFWVSNDIEDIDAAFIRRFDQVIALDTPPKAQRASLLHQAAPGIINQDEALQLAAHPALTPAIISRAGKVVNYLNKNLKRETRQAALAHLIQQTLQAQGHSVPAALSRDVLGPVYDASLVNADVNLTELTQGLKQAGAGRLCLYGPPGTGKTAFCHYLAKQLKLPLLMKSASELMGMYVGQTEKNIAAAFAEAKQNGAILLLDEVDSFLQDRRKARQSWEVTAVNEMLVQMEAFNGIFVASTNLMHNLDQASLRRFDLKACFTYLKPEQARQLFTLYCQQLKLTPCKASLAQVASMQQLTPGDFTAVARQSRFRPLTSASDLAKVLLRDVALKKAEAAKPIGFLQ